MFRINDVFINGKKYPFQDARARQMGGDVVIHVMGSSGYEAGQKTPFQGYMLSLHRIMFPKDFNFSVNMDIDLIFDDGRVFEGKLNTIYSYRHSRTESDSRVVYEDLDLLLDAYKNEFEGRKKSDV